jgi:hypothetical protein
MILLTIIAVGLLSLASISLRASSQGEAMSTARANARIALMLAIGDLQTQTGLDTRITARADILDKNNPPILGAWKSWEGSNHDATGRPVSPGNYKAAKEGRFLKWLISATAANVPNVGPGNNKVTLVGDHSVGYSEEQKKLQIHLDPSQIALGRQKGAFAWWSAGKTRRHECRSRQNLNPRLPANGHPS